MQKEGVKFMEVELHMFYTNNFNLLTLCFLWI
jgi:hypothetical protein